MAIDWKKLILVSDEDSVNMICGKELLWVMTEGGGGGGGGGEAVYLVSARKIRAQTGETGDTDVFNVVYSDGEDYDMNVKRTDIVSVTATSTEDATTIVYKAYFSDGSQVDFVGPKGNIISMEDTLEWDDDYVDHYQDIRITEYKRLYEATSDANVNTFEVNFIAQQEGSGDPSPENIRPFIPIGGFKLLHTADYNLLTTLQSNLADDTEIKLSQGKFYVRFTRGDGTLTTTDFSRIYEYPLALPAGTYYLQETHVYYVSPDPSGEQLNLYLYDNDTQTVIASDTSRTGKPVKFTLSEAKTNLVLYADYLNVANVYTAGSKMLDSKPRIFRAGYGDSDEQGPAGVALEIEFPENIYGAKFDFKTGELTENRFFIESYDGEDLSGYRWWSDRDVYEGGTSPTTGAQVLWQVWDYEQGDPTAQTYQLPFTADELFARNYDIENLQTDGAMPQMHYYDIKSIDCDISNVHLYAGLYKSLYDYVNDRFGYFEAPNNGKYYVRKNRAWTDLYRVKDTQVYLYVDGTNGSDTNDGSDSAPFATIGKAMTVAPVDWPCVIVIAAGTYTEDLSIYGKNAIFSLSGATTVTGDLYITNNSYVKVVPGANGSFTVSGVVSVKENSFLSGNSAGKWFNIASGAAYEDAFKVDQSRVYLNGLGLTGSSTPEITADNASHIYVGVRSSCAIKARYGSIVGYTATGTGVTVSESTSYGGRIYTGAQS